MKKPIDGNEKNESGNPTDASDKCDFPISSDDKILAEHIKQTIRKGLRKVGLAYFLDGKGGRKIIQFGDEIDLLPTECRQHKTTEKRNAYEKCLAILRKEVGDGPFTPEWMGTSLETGVIIWLYGITSRPEGYKARYFRAI